MWHMGDDRKILLQRYVFTDEMLQEVRDSFRQLFKGVGEMRSLISLGRIDSDHLGNLSLGKLRNDVLKNRMGYMKIIKTLSLINRG